MAEEVLEEEQEEEECPKCPPVGAPAWMAPFADMATLLMAFFVLNLSFAEFNYICLGWFRSHLSSFVYLYPTLLFYIVFN